MSRGTANKDHAREPDADEACISLSLLLLRWQASGDTGAFDTLVAQARRQVERVAERVLQQHGLRDPAALDDAVSLVLDHLRRLFAHVPGVCEGTVSRLRERTIAALRARVAD